MHRQILGAADQRFDHRPVAQFEPPATLRAANNQLRCALRFDLPAQARYDILGGDRRDRGAERRGERQRRGDPALCLVV